MTNKQPYGTVLIKAARILDVLSDSDEPKTLNSIAKETELTDSTTLKILDTLVLIGYVHKDTVTKKFSLGTSIVKFANKAIRQLDIKQIAQPHLEKLQKKTTETVHLGILDKTHVVYVSKINSNKSVRLYSQVGKTIPLYCSAMGKAILADQSDEEIKNYLAANALVKKTENTITTQEDLIQEIQTIRERGYAFDNSEHEDDVFCVGASITLGGKNYGALSVSTPMYRITEEFIQEIIQAVHECKVGILNDLQGIPPII